MPQVLLWAVFETALESGRDYPNPLWDVSVRVSFLSPSGRRLEVDAYWDGERTWRVRFCPDEVGHWTWQSACSDSANSGLHGLKGEFECTPSRAQEGLQHHGPLRLSRDHRHFVHADGTPFFFLCDTAWCGVQKAKQQDWERYLATRREQGFTAVQFVLAQWRAFPHDAEGDTAYTGRERIQVNPRYFQRLDEKFAAINQHGLVAVPVLLWAIRGDINPGWSLPEGDAIKLARYMAARYGAYQVIWLLGGDGDYRQEKAERWRRIGRAVFGDRHDRLVTMHPGGRQWMAEEFRNETWFHFIGYQSGHGDSADTFRWLVAGPPAQEWTKTPPRPIINLEPCYEAHLAYQSGQPFDAYKVRRALYWSLLIAPTAGVTYGHHGIWSWAERREAPLDHPRTGEAPPWHEAIRSEGASCVRHLNSFFTSIPWWRLRPAPELLTEQPGEADPTRFVAAAAAEDRSLAVVYMPIGGALALRTQDLKRPAVARWFSPQTGEWKEAGVVAEATERLCAPDSNDWLLSILSSE